jgi:hypothetical protein
VPRRQPFHLTLTHRSPPSPPLTPTPTPNPPTPVPYRDEEAVMEALMRHGPLAVGVDADFDFAFYS